MNSVNSEGARSPGTLLLVERVSQQEAAEGPQRSAPEANAHDRAGSLDRRQGAQVRRHFR